MTDSELGFGTENKQFITKHMVQYCRHQTPGSLSKQSLHSGPHKAMLDQEHLDILGTGTVEREESTATDSSDT